MSGATAVAVQEAARQRAARWVAGLGLGDDKAERVMAVLGQLAGSAPYAVRAAVDEHAPAGLDPETVAWLAYHGIDGPWWIAQWSGDGVWHGDRCGCPHPLCTGTHHRADQECCCRSRLLALVHSAATARGALVEVVGPGHRDRGARGTVQAVAWGSDRSVLLEVGRLVRCLLEDLMPQVWPPTDGPDDRKEPGTAPQR